MLLIEQLCVTTVQNTSDDYDTVNGYFISNSHFIKQKQTKKKTN